MSKLSWFLVTTQDQMIPPDAHSDVVADFIMEAAEAAESKVTSGAGAR